ncbi:MAG: hypothetical protein ABI970_22075, partial [Chloroflexota bacterium]
ATYGIMGDMPPSPDTQPDYHFLLIAPNLGAEWLFDAAREYWSRFRPIVVTDLELVRLIPKGYSIIVTMVARRDTATQWGVFLAQNVPDALLDGVVYDAFEQTRTALNQRAETTQPFGVPLKPTPTPAVPISPTPGSLIGNAVIPPTRAPGGFITQTPTPNMVEPTAAPTLPAEPPGQPVYPTPGPITGG